MGAAHAITGAKPVMEIGGLGAGQGVRKESPLSILAFMCLVESKNLAIVGDFSNWIYSIREIPHKGYAYAPLGTGGTKSKEV